MSLSKSRSLLNDVQISKKIEEMNIALVGYWESDSWDARECPEPSAIEYTKTPSLRNRWIRFGQVENIWLRTELKYFYYVNITNGRWKVGTVWKRKGTAINRMLQFLNQKYPDIQSITEIPLDKALTEFRSFLIDNGVKATTTNYKLDSNNNKITVEANSYYVTNLKQFIEFYLDYYFVGEEWDKDIWDRRRLPIPKDNINPTQNEYMINFTRIHNSYFKEKVKRYCKLKLNTLSFSYVVDIARIVGVFLSFIDKHHSNVKRIKQITRLEVEGYITEINSRNYSPSTIIGQLSVINTFFEDITKFNWKDVPSTILIFQEDYPREVRATPRYINDYVLEQLNRKIDKLDQTTATMVMIIQECGMRISELCTLERNCVITDSEGDCFLKYYQGKMKKEHIVPISRDLAALIVNQENIIREKTGNDFRYLFPREDGSALNQDTFRRNLNLFAYNENIVDRNGKVFRFHAHAFRHTVGTKMINNGVPQHIVQKFLGHESPEMTSRYAHIFDQTMKKEFKKFQEKLVTNKGTIIELEEQNEADDTDLQWFKQNVNAQALPNGYCRLPVVAGPCPHANACLDCTHFCTSKSFLKEHEEHLERTSELLERARQNQWQRQTEMNERVKDRLVDIISSLKEEPV